MQSALVIKGRLTGPRSVELDEPAPAGQGEVEVIVRTNSADTQSASDFIEFLKSLPPGSRSREDIDRQIREERQAWGEFGL